MMALSKQLLSILVCPTCHGRFEYQPSKNRLACPACQKVYPVTDDVPVLLTDQAITLK